MPTVKEIEQLANQLSVPERIQLLRKLEQATWVQRVDAVVTRIRQHSPRLSQQAIQRLCRDVRQERSNRARRA